MNEDAVMANRRCAEWRFPTEKQAHAEETLRRMGATAGAKPPAAAPISGSGPAGPRTEMPEEYWQSVLSDPSAGARTGVPMPQRRMSEISLHLLRVSCRRCDHIVEIQTADAVRLYGAQTIWKDAGQRLLDNGCQNRTGSHEDDGCWANFELR
jgi:hypothetical protein